MNKLLINIFLVFFISVCFSQEKMIHQVYFETDKYEVTPTEESRLYDFIAKMNNIDIDSIAIYGFCDDVGASTYNLKLSKERANAIKAFFANQEISENLISNVDGKGEVLLKIINEKNIPKIRSLNRKVEIIVSPNPPIPKEVVKDTTAIVKEEISPQEKLKGPLKAGDKFVFQNILFKTGYSNVIPESKPLLDEIAETLLKRDDIYFTIEGHVCCTRYSRDAVDRRTMQRNLSEARAKYVYDYFAKKGISTRRMRHLGMRRKFPLGGDPKYDRRVEIVITYAGKEE